MVTWDWDSWLMPLLIKKTGSSISSGPIRTFGVFRSQILKCLWFRALGKSSVISQLQQVVLIAEAGVQVRTVLQTVYFGFGGAASGVDEFDSVGCYGYVRRRIRWRVAGVVTSALCKG